MFLSCSAYRAKALTLLLACALPRLCAAADVWAGTSLSDLCNQFEAVDRPVLQKSVGNFLDVLTNREQLSLDTVRRVDPQKVDPVLKRAVALKMGAMELFSDPQFAAGGPCLLLFDQATLFAIDKQYDLHGLWMVHAPTSAGVLEMTFMLLGQGKLIMGYPRAAAVTVADYRVFTGVYDYQPYTAMDISNANGKHALTNVRTLGAASGANQSFVGPLNSSIKTIQLDGDGNMVVQYRYLFADFQRRINSVAITAR